MCFFIIIIIFFSYINSINKVENFTPKIREFYRPIFRHSRIYSQNLYNQSTSILSNLLRKFGLI